MRSLNGFTIEKWNQYDLPESAKTSTCPLCSHTRKKKKDKCLQLYWDKGLGQCFHCGELLQLHTYKRENEPKKAYERPKAPETYKLSSKVLEFFKSRNISQRSLKAARVSEGKEWMPQFGTQVNTIHFNYFIGGELINVKYRGPQKSFKLAKNAELVLSGIDRWMQDNEVIITEGECFKPDAQVLTKKGWVRFDTYNGIDEIMTVNNNLVGEFQKPLAVIKKDYHDDMVVLSNSKKYYSCTTKEHNIVTVSKKGTVKKRKAIDVYNSKSLADNLPRSIFYSGKGINYCHDGIRLMVAISADFTIRKSGAIYRAFKKERKAKRIEGILTRLGIRHSINIDKRGYFSVFIHKQEATKKYAFKKLPKFLLEMTWMQRCVFIEELPLWDGNYVKGRNQIEYSCIDYENIELVQSLAHLHGYTSTIIRRTNDHGSWYKVSILFNKSYTSCQPSLKRNLVNYKGNVHCVKVKTGMILVRQNECISVSGNCDELSYIEAGFLNVSSVPNGAGSTNLQYIDNCYKYFENKDKVYLSIDNDEAGEKLQKELVRRLGAERCYLIDLGDYKDANEALMNEGVEYLQRAVFDAKQCPLENVNTYQDEMNQYYDYILNGYTPGYGIGLKQFDDIFTTYLGQYIVVTGIPTHGKSDFVDQMCLGYAMQYGWRTAFCSPENKPNFLHVDKLMRKIMGKRIESNHLGTPLFNQVEQFYNDHFYDIDYKKGYDLDKVLEKAAELVKRKGIRVLVLDPYNKVPLKGVSKNNTNIYTTEYLNRIDQFCQEYQCLIILVAHPNKMQIKGETKMPEPSFYDVKGGGEFYDMAYHGILVYRDFELNAVKIKVLKCKFANLGQNQAHTWLMWNPNNGRYSATEGSEETELYPIWDNSSYIQLEQPKQNTDEEAKQYEGFDQECGF